MKHNDIGHDLETALESLREIPPPDKARQAKERAAFLAQAGKYRELAVSTGEPVRHKRRGIHRRYHLTRRPMMLNVFAAIAIVMAMVAGTGGVAYAADGAVPGDPLYGIDQAMESAQLSLTNDPQATMGLLLALADERLLEAEKLPGKGNEKRRQVALGRYEETISSLAQNLSTVEDVDEATLIALFDQSFSAHEHRLAKVFQNTNGDEPDSCHGGDPHPVGKRLAESYDVSYDEVMTWFCSGYGFGEIMHALQTSQRTGTRPEDLLNMKTEMGGWGQVWKAEGIIRRPDHAPAGPPEDKGKGQPDDRPVGPPEDKGKGKPNDRPVGPPEGKSKGQPDDRPVGPPEDKGKGQPDDRPVGPPEDKGKGQARDNLTIGPSVRPKAGAKDSLTTAKTVAHKRRGIIFTLVSPLYC
jgi:hypothetical protein